MDRICGNCKHMREALGEDVVSCVLIHTGQIPLSDVHGQIFEGWYGKGMIYNGIVMKKYSYCKRFEAKDSDTFDDYIKMGRDKAISFVVDKIEEINNKITKLHTERNKFQQHLLFLKEKK